MKAEPDEPEAGTIRVLFAIGWNGWEILVTEDVASSPERRSKYADVAEVTAAINWLRVLASPLLARSLRRRVDRENLIRLLDVYIAYAERGDWYRRSHDEDHERLVRRTPLGRELRRMIAGWSPPVIAPEITDAARALLAAEYVDSPPAGWDAFSNETEIPLEDVLMWPEGIPRALRALAEDPS